MTRREPDIENGDLRGVAADMNVVARFLGVRDLPALAAASVKRAFGQPRADVMVLFGG